MYVCVYVQLVGAGGNAGNQSAIKVIRGLATKQMDGSTQTIIRVVRQQILVGMILGIALAGVCGNPSLNPLFILHEASSPDTTHKNIHLGVGFVRVYLTNGDINNASAISLSLFVIVLTSTALGSTLPFVLYEFGIDPANAGTSIQVSCSQESNGCLEYGKDFLFLQSNL